MARLRSELGPPRSDARRSGRGCTGAASLGHRVTELQVESREGYRRRHMHKEAVSLLDNDDTRLARTENRFGSAWAHQSRPHSQTCVRSGSRGYICFRATQIASEPTEFNLFSRQPPLTLVFSRRYENESPFPGS